MLTYTHSLIHTHKYTINIYTTIPKMGNCFKRSSTDDISLLRGGNEPNRESTEQLGPSPLYSVRAIHVCNVVFPALKSLIHSLVTCFHSTTYQNYQLHYCISFY